MNPAGEGGARVPTVAMLRHRAELFARVRGFFAARDVLEVDTPVLGGSVVVEAAIEPIACSGGRFLLASPEALMKRLLAAGAGPIYQIAHAFRDGESGRGHASEFTMLEWYRPGFDHHALMDEVEALVRELLPAVGEARFRRRTYREVFREGAGVDPFATDLDQVRAACERHRVPLPPGFAAGTVDDALDLLLVGHLQPTLGTPVPEFIHDYPPSQAALARIAEDREGRPVACRFELYVHGVELCNGYYELADPVEQRCRFAQANRIREQTGRPPLPVDEELLAALERGFPACAGVALGIDRLLMVATGAAHIGEVRMLSGS